MRLMENLTIRNLSFAYPGQAPLFDHCNLDLDGDWKLGLLGRNGRGKTTLMKILRNLVNYQGSIITNLKPQYFPLTIKKPTFLAGDAVIEAVPNSFLEPWQLERELNLMATNPEILWQPYSTLSGGERTKLQLAALFASDYDYLLLDEPTNHLDQVGRKQVTNYLRQKTTGFIITSHDREFLDQIIDHTLVIERSQLVLERGNYSTYFKQKKRRDQEAITTNQQLRADIKKLKQSQQQRQQWANRAESEKKNNSHADKGFLGAKAAKMMKKSVTINNRIEQAINDKQGLLNNIDSTTPISLNLQRDHHQTLLAVKDVTLSFSDHQLFDPLNFTVKQNEQVALSGRNGTGKSSLIQAICHQFSGNINGTIELANNITVSTVRQDYSDNSGSLTEFAKANHLELETFLNILRKLGVPRSILHNRIETMSMGQQKKVELARSLATPAHLYIWDEPLNYLDTYNQEQLIDLIQTYQPPLLFVEHDHHFIEQVSSKVICLNKDE